MPSVGVHLKDSAEAHYKQDDRIIEKLSRVPCVGERLLIRRSIDVVETYLVYLVDHWLYDEGNFDTNIIAEVWAKRVDRLTSQPDPFTN